jgi:hypothetical protein
MKRRFGYTKLSSLIANRTLFRTFLFSSYNKNVYKKIAKFTFNIFFVINLLIKINFGISHSLINNKSHVDNYIYLNIENYLSKYFIYLSKFLLKKQNFINKSNYFYYKSFNNILLFKLTKKIFININKIFKSKLKYIDYCYKGLFIKLLIKNTKILKNN